MELSNDERRRWDALYLACQVTGFDPETATESDVAEIQTLATGE